MTEKEKVEFYLYKANKELQHNLHYNDLGTKGIMNWIMTGDKSNNSWDKVSNRTMVVKERDYNKEFNNF